MTEPQIAEMNRMITQIYHVVIGSEHDKEIGLLKRVKDLEDETDKLNKFIDRTKWVVVGMAMPASWGIIQLLVTIFKIKP